MALRRFQSLFWTFAGAFLTVLVVGALLQVVMFIAVVGPLAQRNDTAEAKLQLRDVGAALRGSPLTSESLREALRVVPVRGMQVLALPDAGGVIAPRPLPPMAEAGLEEQLRSGADRIELGPPSRGGNGPRGPRGERGEDRGRPGPRPDFAPDDDLRLESLRVRARFALTLDSGEQVELVALGREQRRPMWPAGAPRPLLLFFPAALALAVAAGLVLFRILVRRLRRLETLAAEVGAGNLEAHIDDPTRDEIGRLGESLNAMAASLREARDRVSAADAQRRRLFADVTHELATPLTSIRGYTETLLDGSVALTPEERAEYLRRVVEESQRMDQLIRDGLELSRLESGGLPLELERLDWAALCMHTLERFRPRFEQAGLTLHILDDPPAIWVQADGRRLEQVLENLLTNALRYVPRGGTIQVQLSHDATQATLELADDGPGIPAHDLSSVFERFFRTDSSRSTAGTGLGLAIVREIAQQHGGNVEALANTPRGARFRVRLPLDKTT